MRTAIPSILVQPRLVYTSSCLNHNHLLVRLMPEPREPQHLPPKNKRLLDDLLDQNSERTISAEDEAALIDLVAEAERLMVEDGSGWPNFSG